MIPRAEDHRAGLRREMRKRIAQPDSVKHLASLGGAPIRVIGGLAGGSKGALIGAVLGAGAGTAGAAYTGEKEIVLPAESALTFTLTEPVTVKK